MKTDYTPLILGAVGVAAVLAFTKKPAAAPQFKDSTWPPGPGPAPTPPVAPAPPPPPVVVAPPPPPILAAPPPPIVAAPPPPVIIAPPAPAVNGTGLDTAVSAAWQKDEFTRQALDLAAKVAAGQLAPGSAAYEAQRDYLANLRGGVAQKGQGLQDLAALGVP